MSMLRHAATSPSRALPVPMRLVESVRTPEELPFADEYGDESTIVYTRRAPAGWPRPAGRLDAATSSRCCIPGATAYVCGSAASPSTPPSCWSSSGMPADAIRVERYGPTG